MIYQIIPSSLTIKPGETVTLQVDGAYPLGVEVYGFLSRPFPAHCVLWPQGGAKQVEQGAPINFTAEAHVFLTVGYLEFRVVDAAGDFRTCNVAVRP